MAWEQTVNKANKSRNNKKPKSRLIKIGTKQRVRKALNQDQPNNSKQKEGAKT